MGTKTRTIANNLTDDLGAGGFQHIVTLTAGGVSSLDFIHGSNSVVLDSTYNVYKIIGHRVDFGSTQGLACRFRVSSSFVTSGYETQSASLRGTATAYDISGGSTSSGYIRMGWQRYTGTTELAGSHVARQRRRCISPSYRTGSLAFPASTEQTTSMNSRIFLKGLDESIPMYKLLK